MQDPAAVRRAFTYAGGFWSSPLYQELSRTVAADQYLLELAGCAQDGQVPSFLFFGAVHWLLLGGTDDQLGDYYPSLRGDAAKAPAGSGPVFTAFVHTHADEIREIVSTRLVQTNHVQRTFGLRVGLALIAAEVGQVPVHLLEIGTSAGLILRQGAYGYRLGERQFGDVESPVQLSAQWRGSGAPPDLDDIPDVASVTGIDLHPLDPALEIDRRWLRALVWPENREQADQLATALELAASLPVRTLAGNAVDRCPEWDAQLPAGAPRVVFHCATRIHVPAGQRASFDAAIDALGIRGPLFHLAIEDVPNPVPRRATAADGFGLTVTGPDGQRKIPVAVDGHLTWIAPGPG